MNPIDDLENIDEAVLILEGGGVIVYPTETVYGMGCLASEHAAIDRIAGLKGSGSHASYIVLIRSLDFCSRFCDSVPQVAEKLAAAFWPGPLTLILPARRALHPRLIGPSSGVALRISPHPWPKAILERVDDGLISTSANVTGYVAPSSFDDLDTDITTEVDLTIDGGNLPGGISTVLDLCGVTPVLLREGALTADQLARVLELELINPGFT